jgi:putative membrane protein
MDPTWGNTLSMFWIFPLLCLVFMVAMIFMMFRRGDGCMPMGRRDTSSNGTRDTPRQILDRRLASGQITVEQYDSMRHDLESSGGSR